MTPADAISATDARSFRIFMSVLAIDSRVFDQRELAVGDVVEAPHAQRATHLALRPVLRQIAQIEMIGGVVSLLAALGGEAFAPFLQLQCFLAGICLGLVGR